MVTDYVYAAEKEQHEHLYIIIEWTQVQVHIYDTSLKVPDVKLLDNLIGWTLTYVSKVTLNLNLSQLRCHPETRDAMLAPVPYYLYTHTCNNQPPPSAHKM